MGSSDCTWLSNRFQQIIEALRQLELHPMMLLHEDVRIINVEGRTVFYRSNYEQGTIDFTLQGKEVAERFSRYSMRMSLLRVVVRLLSDRD